MLRRRNSFWPLVDRQLNTNMELGGILPTVEAIPVNMERILSEKFLASQQETTIKECCHLFDKDMVPPHRGYLNWFWRVTLLME